MKMLFDLQSWLTLLWAWLIFVTGEICTQLEEGKEGKIACNSTEDTLSIMAFEVERNGGFVEVASCNTENICKNSFPSQYQAEYQPLLYPKRGQLTLTIKNVTRNEDSFRCIINAFNSQGICELEVYVKPNVPTCEAPYQTTDYRITLTCATDRVYPKVHCKFYEIDEFAPEVDTKSYLSTISRDYLRAVCILHINSRGLTPRVIRTTVGFFPLMPLRNDQGTFSVANITLSAPTASLGSDCPKDYIVPGSTVTCTCQLSSPGFPRGQAQWYNRFNDTVGINNTKDGSSVMKLEYNTTDGPSEISIETEGSTFNKCPSKSLVIPIICKVDHIHINPQPLFTILIDNNVQVKRKEGHLVATYYRYTYLFTPSSSGSCRVTCQVQNSVFSELVLSKSTMVTVREPPSSAPVLTTSKGKPDSGDVIVTDLEELEVTCRIDGGSPRVKQVTLSCGQNKSVSLTRKAILRILSTDSATEQRCYCSGVHVTGCYDKVAELILHQGNVSRSAGHSGTALKFGIGVGVSALMSILTVIGFVVYCVKRRTTFPGPTKTYDYQVTYDIQTERQTCEGLNAPEFFHRQSTSRAHVYHMVDNSEPAESLVNSQQGESILTSRARVYYMLDNCAPAESLSTSSQKCVHTDKQ